jgi:hypothetical protein
MGAVELSIHDNRLLGYSVDDEKREILFRTEFQDNLPIERTNIIFSGVETYFFEHHSLPLGTILFDVEENDLILFLQDNRKRFQDGIKWGWPGPWGISIDETKAYIEKHELKAFSVSSSCGLSGWILAKSFLLKKV